MSRIKLLFLVMLFIFISGCAHHIVNGVEIRLPEPDQDPVRKSRF